MLSIFIYEIQVKYDQQPKWNNVVSTAICVDKTVTAYDINLPKTFAASYSNDALKCQISTNYILNCICVQYSHWNTQHRILTARMKVLTHRCELMLLCTKIHLCALVCVHTRKSNMCSNNIFSHIIQFAWTTITINPIARATWKNSDTFLRYTFLLCNGAL